MRRNLKEICEDIRRNIPKDTIREVFETFADIDENDEGMTIDEYENLVEYDDKYRDFGFPVRPIQ